MTIDECIAEVDRVHPNNVPLDIKIGWLSRIDQYVAEEIIRGREGADGMTFEAYTMDDGQKTLLVPPPYDELYVHRLDSNISFEEHEDERQANAMALYNQTMQDYAKKYIREHRAKPHPRPKYY